VFENGQGLTLENEKGIEKESKIKVTGSVLHTSEVRYSEENTLVTDSAGNDLPEKEAAVMGDEKRSKPIPPVHFYAWESEQRILELVKPLYVVVYDIDMAFVRELEVYKAMNPHRPLKVYFLLYEESTEGRRFEASIKKENAAFENLIRQKATMTIPVDQVFYLTLPCLSRCILMFSRVQCWLLILFQLFVFHSHLLQLLQYILLVLIIFFQVRTEEC